MLLPAPPPLKRPNYEGGTVVQCLCLCSTFRPPQKCLERLFLSPLRNTYTDIYNVHGSVPLCIAIAADGIGKPTFVLQPPTYRPAPTRNLHFGQVRHFVPDPSLADQSEQSALAPSEF
uniref:Uncharacterized protein n=1 Tax=Schistocephalus solidus TaxID=70667 RepID=A0A0X3PFE4_SCHSO